MQKRKLKWYKVKVQQQPAAGGDVPNTALVFCEIFDLGARPAHPAAEFHLKFSTFPNDGLSITSDPQASFQEELRVMHEAAMLMANRQNEAGFIQACMLQAFGDAAVNITAI